MPFGLCNAPATFRHLMRIVLNGIEWNGVLAYLDDIIVYGRNFAEHISVLNSVLTRVEKAGLKLKSSKCCLLQREVKFLGHVVSRNDIRCNPEKTNCIAKWPVPTTPKEVQQFLGLASYYLKFVKNFAKIAAPLYDASKTDKRNFNWTENCEQSFCQLKAILTSPPVLKYPDQNETFIVDCDASNLAIGCVLSQETDGEEHSVAFASKTLNKAERNYSTTRKELLAVVFALKHFRCYLDKAFLLRQITLL